MWYKFTSPTKGEGRQVILAKYYGLKACNGEISRSAALGCIALLGYTL